MGNCCSKNKISTHTLNECKSISLCPSINRIIKYLEIYQKIKTEDIYKEFNSQKTPHLTNDFNHVTMHHLSDSKSLNKTQKEYEEIYNYIIKKMKINKTNICSLETCNKFERNNRNKDDDDDNNNNNKIDDYDDEIIYYIETMDTMHCFFIHSFDIGFRLKLNDRNNIIHNDDDEINDNLSIIKLSNLLKSKRERLRNVRGINLMNNNKFITQIADDKGI